MKVRLFVALLLVPAMAEGGAFSWKKVEEEKRFKGFFLISSKSFRSSKSSNLSSISRYLCPG